MRFLNVIDASILLIPFAASVFAAEVGTPFVALPSYGPGVGGVTYLVDLGNKARAFDFGGNTPFINPASGVADIATINVWDSRAKQAMTLRSYQINPAGVPARVFKTGAYTAVGYVRGDGIVEGKLRTMINSFPIPARRHFVWDLSFRLGGGNLAAPWVFTPKGVAPATLWQLKTSGLPPALVMAVDSDPSDDRRLLLNFDARLDPAKPAIRLGDVAGIDPAADTSVRIEAFLDERPVSAGGKGFLRISVNDRLIVDRWGPVLQTVASWPYHWSLAMYLYANTAPLDFDRFSYWRRARLLVR